MFKWFRNIFMSLREQDEEWMREQTKAEIRKTLKDIRMNLEGVISDCEGGNGFDDVCLETVKRCSAQISTVMKQLYVEKGSCNE